VRKHRSFKKTEKLQKAEKAAKAAKGVAKKSLEAVRKILQKIDGVIGDTHAGLNQIAQNLNRELKLVPELVDGDMARLLSQGNYRGYLNRVDKKLEKLIQKFDGNKELSQSLSKLRGKIGGSLKGGKRVFNIKKAQSPIWKKFKQHRGKTFTNGLKGKKKEFYEWDYTHNDIEVYDSKGRHL